MHYFKEIWLSIEVFRMIWKRAFMMILARDLGLVRMIVKSGGYEREKGLRKVRLSFFWKLEGGCGMTEKRGWMMKVEH